MMTNVGTDVRTGTPFDRDGRLLLERIEEWIIKMRSDSTNEEVDNIVFGTNEFSNRTREISHGTTTVLICGHPRSSVVTRIMMISSLECYHPHDCSSSSNHCLRMWLANVLVKRNQLLLLLTYKQISDLL